MKKTLLLPLVALALAGCTAAQNAAAPSPARLSAQASGNSVYCPPNSLLCGNHMLAQRPNVGGDIIPADWTITGTRELGSLLGQNLQGRFPAGGNSRFYVGRVLFTVGQLDRAFYGKAFTFSLQSVRDQGNGQFTYGYTGRATP